MTSKKLLCIGLVLMAAVCQLPAQSAHVSGTYEDSPFLVPKASEAMIIDGRQNEISWQKAQTGRFDFFYKHNNSREKQKTRFKLLWDEENLYLFYQAEDEFITARETERDGKPFVDDCAEIFLIPVDEKIDMHFGFEINLFKTPNDIVFLNNMYKGKVVVKPYNPQYEVAANVEGTINDNSDKDRGWSMEVAIPFNALRTVGNLSAAENGTRWFFLALRQDRNEIQGERVVTSTLFPLSDEEKNVHNPENFGLLEFVD